MNLLFIAPLFFGYEKAIAADLKSRYHKVIFRSEVPFNSTVRFYALRRLFPKLANRVQNRYTRQLLQIIKNEKINRIFVIRGYGIREEFFSIVRTQYPQIEIINYQWDSIQNNPNGLMISKYAHKNYSFDLKDTENYPQFTHLPLFYNWNFSEKTSKEPEDFEKDIDVLFIGGYQERRNEIVKIVREACKNQGLQFVYHIYLPLGSYLRDCLTERKISRKDVTFKKVSRKKYYQLLCRSRVVLDIQSITQTGATIRCIESLSLKRKLVSTNQVLKQEQFFSPENIMIWNPDEPFEISGLLRTPFNNAKNQYILDKEKWLSEMGI